ncbi:MAG: hypothetical protein ACE369_09045 [Roseovarius sp.]
MTHDADAPAAPSDHPAIPDTVPETRPVPMSELSARIRKSGELVEASAYHAAGRAHAETVAKLIIVAAELEGLAGKLAD